MVDHNGPISHFPAARMTLQFAITAEIVQVLILSVILANYCLHSRYSKPTFSTDWALNQLKKIVLSYTKLVTSPSCELNATLDSIKLISQHHHPSSRSKNSFYCRELQGKAPKHQWLHLSARIWICAYCNKSINLIFQFKQMKPNTTMVHTSLLKPSASLARVVQARGEPEVSRRDPTSALQTGGIQVGVLDWTIALPQNLLILG